MKSRRPDPASTNPSPEIIHEEINPLMRQPTRWLPSAGVWLLLLALCASIAARRVQAQAAPGLTISQTSSNQVQITVTNAAAGARFELQRTDDFNYLAVPEYVWPSPIVGAIGQTNFVMEMGIPYAGFFRVLGCVDCDNDGVLNYLDAQPGNTNVGILFITIDSPANNSNVQ